MENDGAIDLAQVYPRMFVRVRDTVSGKDTAAQFPGVDELVNQANAVPQKYAAVYPEFEALVEVFRAYVVAVQLRDQQPGICPQLPHNLLESEKTGSSSPEYHPTDFAMSIGWYEYSDGDIRRAIAVGGGLFQGGVSIGARRLVSSYLLKQTTTPIISAIKSQAVIIPPDKFTWKANGRQFLSFVLDVGDGG